MVLGSPPVRPSYSHRHQGYKSAGLMTMGKHFPSYGNLQFLGTALDVPTITESLEQLAKSALIPFRNAIEDGIDAIMVGGCAMSSEGLEAMHACLSERVVDELMRNGWTIVLNKGERTLT